MRVMRSTGLDSAGVPVSRMARLARCSSGRLAFVRMACVWQEGCKVGGWRVGGKMGELGNRWQVRGEVGGWSGGEVGRVG